MPEYKYQSLFDEHNLECDCLQNGQTLNAPAFRWVIDPINHSLNFLPNILYDIAKDAPRRINSVKDDMKCGYCALSFFISKEAAIKKYKGIPKRVQQLIGYNCIAEGTITDKDGVISDIIDEHFNFYEYTSADLKQSFVITTELI